MGITGLLPLLKSIQQPTHLKEFAGQVVGVDGYVWLHRGAIACAADLALGKPTHKYVDYAMHRVKMLQHFGVKPYLVFDGANLPSKRHTELDRKRGRAEARETAMKLLNSGRANQAHEYFQKSIDITPAMAAMFIRSLEKANVPYVVAPYEADAQLAYLEKLGLISAIVSEDSDLLVFGVSCLLTKLNEYGDCIALRRSKLGECKDIDLSSFDDTLFRHMAIIAGCDYTPGIPNVGLKKAHMYLKRYKSAERAMRMMALDGKIKIPMNFRQEFERADITFQYQRVYDPILKKVIMWNELKDFEISESLDHSIGPPIDDDIARGIANGRLDPTTYEVISEHLSSTERLASSGKPLVHYFQRLTPRSPLSDVTNSPKKSQPALMSSFSVWPQPKPARQADFSEKERLAIKRIRALSPQHTDENCSNVVVNSRYFSAATIANDLPEENLAESENLEISDEDMQATFNDIHRLESMNNEKHDSLQQTIMLAEKEDTAIESPQNSGSQQTSNEKSTISMTRSSRFDAFTLTPPLSAKSGTHCPPLRQMTADSSPSSMISTPRLSSTTSSSLLTPLSSRPASFTEGTITPLLSKNRFLHFSAPCDSCESPLSTSLTRRPSVRRPTVNGKGIGSMPTLSKSSRTVSLDRYVSSNNIQAKRVRSETSTQRLKSAKSEAWSFQSHLDRFRAS
ncbi:PIN domain-like protein [Kockiozyma suomiensis]|uniref:PIN domain-like protein n=1 Tax=Kockiozyma suomiensis TaxID=1337062 RepID=UPI003343C2BF